MKPPKHYAIPSCPQNSQDTVTFLFSSLPYNLPSSPFPLTSFSYVTVIIFLIILCILIVVVVTSIAGIGASVLPVEIPSPFNLPCLLLSFLGDYTSHWTAKRKSDGHNYEA